MDYYEFRKQVPARSDAPGVQAAAPKPVPSASRLVNLALGVVALAGFLLFPFAPSQWLSPWLLTRGSLEDLHPANLLAAQLGVDYFLLVSVLLAVFVFAGLHRKLDAPTVRFGESGLTAAWIIFLTLVYVAAWVGARYGQDAGIVMFVIGIYASPFWISALVFGTVGAVRELRVLRAQPAATPCSTRVLAAWALVPPLLLVLPVISAPSNPIERSMAENARYQSLCREAGVKLLDRPVGPVRSIAFDWGPGYFAYSIPFYGWRYQLSPNGKIGSVGGARDLMYEGHGQQAQFDFIESRMDNPSDPTMPYRRQLRGDRTFYTTPSLTADVLAMLEVDESKWSRSAVGYRLTLTDRRSGALLGLYKFVLDTTNRRACGASPNGYVEPMAFISEAIHRAGSRHR